MKLTHLTIGILILGASVMSAQQNTRVKATKQDSTKTTKVKVDKSDPSKIKISKKDSLKSKRPKKGISADYCPPCGMG